MTLFEKYGGFSSISEIVRSFYRDVIESPRLRPYFENIDMATLIDHQTKFMSHALGGPATYNGRSLSVAHKDLNITQVAFDEVAEILQDVLENAGMEADDVATVMSVIGQTMDDIVTIVS
jgi:hemoglobin